MSHVVGTRVYYWKDIKWLTDLSFVEDGKEVFPTKEQFEKEYVKVADFNLWEANPEDVWTKMNLETDKYLDETSYAQMTTPHTSMSIGDIVEFDGKFFIAVSVGFKELPW